VEVYSGVNESRSLFREATGYLIDLGVSVMQWPSWGGGNIGHREIEIVFLKAFLFILGK
jgi:hypothetical protein